MKRFLSMMALALLACIATMAATVKKTSLKVLYVGGHSDIETFGNDDYDKAEKPSVAQSIAKVLCVDERKDGYMEGNGSIVSWCVGHW